MINIESKVTDTVIRAMRSEYPKAIVEDRYNGSPAGFPFVAIYEMSNTIPHQYVDNCENELYANIAYEVQIFTNDKLKKATAKAIADFIDGIMRGMGFNRTFYNSIPNIDRTIYRIAIRYQAIVRKGIETGENETTYLLYQ